MRVCLVAAPLVARSGVYRSARETVAAAQARGLNWSLFLGVSSKAGGAPSANDPEWITEVVAEPGGLNGVKALGQMFRNTRVISEADVVISLNPQADMALALSRRTWVAYVRGLPWPAKGETSAPKRLLWRMLETCALGRACEVWSTTPVLAADLGRIRSHIVQAGIALVPPRVGAGSSVVWAARYDSDKNPALFLEILRRLPTASGVMYGSGPLRDQLALSAPTNVTIGGWKAASELWDDASIYVGTSTREAFGRSAIEAAMAGVPIVLSDAFGVAEFLYTDPALRRRFVLPPGDLSGWTKAVSDLTLEIELRDAVIRHLQSNARRLTIDASVDAMAARMEQVVESLP